MILLILYSVTFFIAFSIYFSPSFLLNILLCSQVTHLLPDAVGTTCNLRLEKVFGADHSHILRVPFREGNLAQMDLAL